MSGTEGRLDDLEVGEALRESSKSSKAGLKKSQEGSAMSFPDLPAGEEAPTMRTEKRLSLGDEASTLTLKRAQTAPLLPSKSVMSAWAFTAVAPDPDVDDLDDDDEEMEDEEEEGEDEAGDHPYKDDHSYEKIKDNYDRVQGVLEQTEEKGVNLEVLRQEFQSLWEGINASHSNELRLMRIDCDVSVELSAAMAKSRQLIRIAEDNPALAALLGEKLERTWHAVDIGEAHEKVHEGQIEQLKQEIFELNRNINNAATVEGQAAMKDLILIRANLEEERDLARGVSDKLRFTLNELFSRRQEFFDRRMGLEERSKFLDHEFNAQNWAIVRESARKEHLTNELEEISSKLETKMMEIEEWEANLQNAMTRHTETEKAVHEQRAVNEAASRDAEFCGNRIEKLRADFEHQQRLIERLTLDAYRRAQEIRLKEKEVNDLKLELHRATRQRSLNLKKVVALQQALGTLDIERESLKTKILILEKDLENAQKKLETNKKRVEELDKERGFVNRNLKRAVAVTTEHSNQAKTHEIAVRTLEQAVKMYGEEIGVQQHTIFRLEKERDFYSHEATKLAQQVAISLNDIKKFDVAIFQYKKRLGALEGQVKKTQQIYDIAIYDKAVFERTLKDTLGEIQENNLSIKHLNNQVAFLKYQVNEKDETIHREAIRYDRILKETEFYSTEARRKQRQAEDMQRQTEALEGERSLLGGSVAEMEGEMSKVNYYLGAAESSQEMYQRKLMKTEGELRNVWEKWRELHSTIRIGAYHFRNVLREIQKLRLDILISKKQLATQAKTVGNYKRLQHELAIVENGVSQEKCMINSLKEQMRHPINIHRWRYLEAIDPEAYQLVLKINLLTKRLVERNNQLKGQTKELDEKQTMYVEVRASIERSPGLEVPEEVRYYQALLSFKSNQLGTLRKEFALAEIETQQYRDQVSALHSRMLELKQQFFQNMSRRYNNRSGFTNIQRVRCKTAVA